ALANEINGHKMQNVLHFPGFFANRLELFGTVRAEVQILLPRLAANRNPGYSCNCGRDLSFQSWGTFTPECSKKTTIRRRHFSLTVNVKLPMPPKNVVAMMRYSPSSGHAKWMRALTMPPPSSSLANSLPVESSSRRKESISLLIMSI